MAYGHWGEDRTVTLRTMVFDGRWSVEVIDEQGGVVATHGGHATERSAIARATVRAVLYGYTVRRPPKPEPKKRRRPAPKPAWATTPKKGARHG